MKRENFFDEIVTILKKDKRFVDSEKGELLRNAVFEAAQKMDAALLKVLLANPTARKAFFTEVDGIQVFDKQKFGWVVSNQSFLPDSYTRFRNKIGLTTNDSFISATQGVELVFPYKDCVLEGGQDFDSASREEIFYNAMLARDETDHLLATKVFSL